MFWPPDAHERSSPRGLCLPNQQQPTTPRLLYRHLIHVRTNVSVSDRLSLLESAPFPTCRVNAPIRVESSTPVRPLGLHDAGDRTRARTFERRSKRLWQVTNKYYKIHMQDLADVRPRRPRQFQDDAITLTRSLSNQSKLLQEPPPPPSSTPSNPTPSLSKNTHPARRLPPATPSVSRLITIGNRPGCWIVSSAKAFLTWRQS